MKNLRSEAPLNPRGGLPTGNGKTENQRGSEGKKKNPSLRPWVSAVPAAPVLLTSIALLTASPLLAAPDPAPALRVVVNSNQDGPVQPDDVLTLREAIELINGTLPLDQLSAAERAQVEQLGPGLPARIDFNLPTDQTT
ncbi:MAG: hypothetical protein WCA35_07835, partial [Kovacikia sp.]